MNSLPQITEIYTITVTQKESHRNLTTDHTITVSTAFLLVVFLMEYYLGKGKLLTGHLREKRNEKWFIIFNYPYNICRSCSDVSSLIPHINNLSYIFLFINLTRHFYYSYSYQKSNFSFYCFCPLFFCFLLLFH